MADVPPPRAVERLRSEIARVDRSILELVARRETLVQQLFVTKDKVALPRFDPGQEAVVLARARAWASELALDPGRVTEAFRQLMESGKRAGRVASALGPSADASVPPHVIGTAPLGAVIGSRSRSGTVSRGPAIDRAGFPRTPSRRQARAY